MTIEDSAFAEVLALVDACAAAFVPHELQNVERDSLQVAVASPAQLSRLSEASKMLRRVQKGPKTVKNAKSSRSTRQKPVKQPKGRRPAGYNPNQAREKQRNEILSLRAQVEELEKVQSTLRSAVVEVSGSSNGNKSGGGAKKREEQVWKELAVRQIEQQALAENEGKRLQEKIEIQEKIVAKLQQFFSKASSKGIAVASRHSVMPPSLVHATLNFDSSVFQDMLDQVNERYQSIDRVFRDDLEESSGNTNTQLRNGGVAKDAEGHLYFQLFGHKLYPYDVRAVGDAAWERFSYTVRPNDTNIFSQYYESLEDTIIEIFGTKLQIGDQTAVVFATQVKRVFHENGRVSIVWQTKLDVVEFMGREISGAEYQENGYFLVERPPLAPDGFAKLRTCYIITPSIPTRSLPRDSMAFALMEFVFKWMADTIPTNHQILEDMLVLESIGATPSVDSMADAHMQARHRAARRHRCTS